MKVFFLSAIRVDIITLNSFYDSLFIASAHLSKKYHGGFKKAVIDVIVIIALRLLLASVL